MTKLEIITDEKKLPTLKEAQEFVGGYIEAITFPNDDLLIINEEGKLKELPYNSDASEVWVSHYGMTDAIVGDALLIKADARDGERW
jgi:hypothetical protein|tara:strand:+ start:358 stop:618 length:261 start_codon:yes stop_codon:yes gene_type:complete